MGVGLDQVQDLTVAVIARLDAVDRAVEGASEALDVVEIVQTCLMGVVRNRQRIFRAVEVHPHHLDRLVGQEGRTVLLHRGHPVAQKDVDVLVLHGGEGHRDGQHGHLGLIAQALQHQTGDCGGGGDVGPADVRQAHRAARGGLRRPGRRARAHHEGAQRQRPKPPKKPAGAASHGDSVKRSFNRLDWASDNRSARPIRPAGASAAHLSGRIDQTKPRLAVEKFFRLGKMVARSVEDAPNQAPSVAAY